MNRSNRVHWGSNTLCARMILSILCILPLDTKLQIIPDTTCKYHSNLADNGLCEVTILNVLLF